MKPAGDTDAPRRGRGRRRRRALLLAAAAIALEVVGLRGRGYNPCGGRVLARCTRGHLFTTIWIPAVSLKAVRLGWWRIQRCPVGRHWGLVALADRSRLSESELAAAGRFRDIRIP